MPTFLGVLGSILLSSTTASATPLTTTSTTPTSEAVIFCFISLLLLLLFPVFNPLSLVFKSHLVLLSKVVAEIDTFLVFDLIPVPFAAFFLLFFLVVDLILLIVESQKRIGIDLGALLLEVVDYVQVSLELILCLESHIALLLALFVRTDEVGKSKVLFQVGILGVVDVLALWTTKRAS